ncbi:MAG: hypothetical protein LBO06_05930 [Bacteroidales bacterium]|jgi:heme exporter protein D|nr:hypothetical protein [Bacteroidales bacterium]
MKPKFITLLLFLAFGLASFAQCPFGNGTKVNCVYGCGRFIDDNNDGFCDNGSVEKAPETEQTEAIPNVEQPQIKKEQPQTKQQPAQTKQEQPQAKQEIPAINQQPPQPKNQETKTEKPYPLIEISAIVMLFYFLTMALVKLGMIRKITHRRIWNVVLLLSFIGSCFGGFYLVAQLNYRFNMGMFALYLKIHVWSGVVMTLVGLIHILWHLPYFKRMLSAKKQSSE